MTQYIPGDLAYVTLPQTSLLKTSILKFRVSYMGPIGVYKMID